MSLENAKLRVNKGHLVKEIFTIEERKFYDRNPRPRSSVEIPDEIVFERLKVVLPLFKAEKLGGREENTFYGLSLKEDRTDEDLLTLQQFKLLLFLVEQEYSQIALGPAVKTCLPQFEELNASPPEIVRLKIPKFDYFLLKTMLHRLAELREFMPIVGIGISQLFVDFVEEPPILTEIFHRTDKIVEKGKKVDKWYGVAKAIERAMETK